MGTVTAQKLSDTVGALVEGVDDDQLLHDPDFPAWCHDALEANGALVFKGLHLDDDTQVAGTQYGATPSNAQNRNRLRYAGFATPANPCNP
jgi:hypothetical protein